MNFEYSYCVVTTHTLSFDDPALDSNAVLLEVDEGCQPIIIGPASEVHPAVSMGSRVR